MPSTEPRRVGILGLGHIGGALAGRLAERGWPVVGYDPDPQAASEIANRFGVEAAPALEVLARSCELLVIACPTPVVPAVLAEVARLGYRGTLAEVASVKGEILTAKERLGAERLVSLHPMAGRELGGAASADPAIFDGARWAIVLSGREPEDAVEEAVALVSQGVGNELLGLEAHAHDKVMALVTALPHVTAILLARALERAPDPDLVAMLAAGSLRDGVRVARTPPERLVELLTPNARDLARELAELLRDAEALGAALGSREELLALVGPASAGAQRVIGRGMATREVTVAEGELARTLLALGRQGWCLRALAHEGSKRVASLVGGAAAS